MSGAAAPVDVTIAICTLNRAELLRATLGSFRNITVPAGTRWEVIVVDNGSTDDTADVVGSFEGRLPVRREVETRRGQSVARNRALRSARGRVIVWTDDDVVVDRHWITATLDAFRRFDADIVFGRSYPIWRPHPPTWFGPAFAGQFALLDYGDQPFVVTESTQQFYGVNMAFTRAAMDTLGAFREDLGYVGGTGGGADDTEMFRRALASGLKIVYAPDAGIGHVIPPERATATRQRRAAWSGAVSNYRLIREQFTHLPMLLGVPRFMFRLAAADVARLVLSVVALNRSEAFYREIRLIQFAGLLRQARLALSSGQERSRRIPA